MDREGDQSGPEGTNRAAGNVTGASKMRYDQLKQQVRDIKAEHKGIQHAKACDRESKAAAIADLCQDYEARLEAERRAAAALQQRLKESLDRSARMRQHAERDKRAQAAAVEKLQAALDAAARDAEGRAAEEGARREREAAEWEVRLQAQRDEMEEASRQQEASRLAFITEVEEWSQGEIEAVQAAAATRVEAAENEACTLREEVESLNQQLQARDAEAAQLQQQLAEARAAATKHEEAAEKLQRQLNAAEAGASKERERHERDAAAWQSQLEAARREQEVVVRAIKGQHVAELDQVHTKLQSVLRRKDARLAAVQAQLAAAEERQRQTEALLERQGGALLAGEGGGGAAPAVVRPRADAMC